MLDNMLENLNTIETENFRRIVNQLLGKTFIVNNIYDPNKETMIMNPDYRFIERNLELFTKYLEIGGWKLERNDNYEVIYITSQYAYNRVRLDKFTTILLYLLRLIYDEKREGINLTEQVIVSVSEIVATLNEIGAYDKKKPTAQELKTGLRTIANYHIIQKIDGAYEDPETKIIILPSILFAITVENITKISKNMQEMEEIENEEENVGEEIEWKY